MKKAFPYKNLHQYLDLVFVGIEPTPEQVILQKKAYWKAYNTHLKQNQRAKRKEVTITLDKELLEMLLQKSSNGSLSNYIKQVLLQHTSQNSIDVPLLGQDSAVLEQQLFLVTDYLQGILYQRRIIDKEAIAKLESLLLKLKQLLEDKF